MSGTKIEVVDVGSEEEMSGERSADQVIEYAPYSTQKSDSGVVYDELYII